MDIQKIVTEAVKALTENEALLKEFNANPGKTLEKKLGIDLPEEQIDAVVKAIKAKLGADDVLEAAGKIMGLFGKK